MRFSTTLAALGDGIVDGEMAGLIVTDPITLNSTHQKLWWSAKSGKWISKPRTVITGVDGAFSSRSGATGDWSYLGVNNSTFGHWNLRAGGIPFAGELFAAGLKIQDRMSCRILDSGSGSIGHVSPWFYEYSSDNTSQIMFSNDQAALAGFTWNGHADLGFAPSKENIGHGVVLKSLGDSVARQWSDGTYDDDIVGSPYHTLTRAKDWDYVKFFVASQPVGQVLGGVPTSTPYIPTKHFLYPTLYGFGFFATQGVAAPHWQYRWSS